MSKSMLDKLSYTPRRNNPLLQKFRAQAEVHKYLRSLNVHMGAERGEYFQKVMDLLKAGITWDAIKNTTTKEEFDKSYEQLI